MSRNGTRQIEVHASFIAAKLVDVNDLAIEDQIAATDADIITAAGLLHPSDWVTLTAEQMIPHVRVSLAKSDIFWKARAAAKAAGECPGCIDKNGPPHTASTRCESGGRNHCTCSVCF